MAKGMGARRRGRELALQALYALDVDHARASTDRAVERAVKNMRTRASEPQTDDEDLREQVRASGEALEFAEHLVRGVVEQREVIDELLGQCSTNWKVPRMAIVDRNILRVATFELRFLDDIPPKVSINEAIEVAKRYGTGESSAFINGILDRVATRTSALAGRSAAVPSSGKPKGA